MAEGEEVLVVVEQFPGELGVVGADPEGAAGGEAADLFLEGRRQEQAEEQAAEAEERLACLAAPAARLAGEPGYKPNVTLRGMSALALTG